jgi:RNA polymerase sigma factor (sigma-70 family)
MRSLHRLTDAELLEETPSKPKAFGVFYRRHEQVVMSFLNGRCRDAELTADLTAETFARALEGVQRFDPERVKGDSAVPWLLGIAHKTFVSSVRRGVVADEARRRLGGAPLALDDEALVRVEQRAQLHLPLQRLLEDLPDDLREAVIARVLEERDYGDIAAQLGCSQQVVRKRVSRGLGRLRSILQSGGE